MNFGKLDPDLSLALEDADPANRSLGIWVEFDHAPDLAETATLKSLGIAVDPGETMVSTETSPMVLDALSSLPIVRRLGLSHRLRTLAHE